MFSNGRSHRVSRHRADASVRQHAHEQPHSGSADGGSRDRGSSSTGQSRARCPRLCALSHRLRSLQEISLAWASPRLEPAFVVLPEFASSLANARCRFRLDPFVRASARRGFHFRGEACRGVCRDEWFARFVRRRRPRHRGPRNASARSFGGIPCDGARSIDVRIGVASSNTSPAVVAP